MYWTQDENPDNIPVPDDIFDVLFSLDCRQIPVDHAFALSEALTQALPWLSESPGCAIHSIHVAGSQNGWQRPTHGTDSLLHLSRRTKLAIRTPAARVEPLLRDLPGVTLTVGGCALRIGEGRVRPLSKETTLFSRHVAAIPGQSEDDFLGSCAVALGDLSIRMRKALCGIATDLATANGPLPTRSLLVADLSTEESFRLQREGLGPHRLMGCGVFIPHKGIDAVEKGR